MGGSHPDTSMSFPVSALLIGMWSAAHCLAMCGGLALAVGQSQSSQLRLGSGKRALRLATWQIGRIMSYSIMGFLAGSLGGLFLANAPVAAFRDAAFIAANLMLIALGLHVAQLWSGISRIEILGQQIWRFIAPMAQATIMPQVRSQHGEWRLLIDALRAGAIWGWLPCGLVYSMLVTASVTGSGASGALWMLAFGMGTVPALWLASMVSGNASRFIRHKRLRAAMGLLISAFGVWGLLRVTGVIQLTWLDAFCIGGSSFSTP